MGVGLYAWIDYSSSSNDITAYHLFFPMRIFVFMNNPERVSLEASEFLATSTCKILCNLATLF